MAEVLAKAKKAQPDDLFKNTTPVADAANPNHWRDEFHEKHVEAVVVPVEVSTVAAAHAHPGTLAPLKVRDGKALANSRDVALMFGKEHKNILRDIDDLVAEIGSLNFEPSSYRSEQNKSMRCFEMDRDGFTLLAMGFTGKDAFKFKLAYIAEFNRMKAGLRGLVTAA